MKTKQIWHNLQFLSQSLLVTLVSSFIFAGCSPQKLKTEDSCYFVQNVYGQRVSWKGKLPVDLYLHTSFPEEMIPAIDGAAEQFEKALGQKVFNLKGYVSGEAKPKQDGKSVIYWMNTWDENKMSEQARTSIYWAGDSIYESDMRINQAVIPNTEQKKYNMYLTTPRYYSDIHLESLMVHEMGHILGLKHNDEQVSVMSTYLGSQEVRSEVTPFDLKSLKCEY